MMQLESGILRAGKSAFDLIEDEVLTIAIQRVRRLTAKEIVL